MRKRKIWILGLLFISILCLSGCKKNNENLELEKGLSEIHFLENRCITLISKTVSGDYETVEGKVDWDLLAEEYNVLDNAINVILIDFASLKIPSKKIVQLENKFVDLNLLVQSRNLNGFIYKLCDCYSYISNNVLENFPIEDSIKKEKQLKSKFLYIGSELLNNDLEKSLSRIEEFQNFYNEMLIEKGEYLDDNYYLVNSIFLDIQKLRALVEKGDFKSSQILFLDILKTL